MTWSRGHVLGPGDHCPHCKCGMVSVLSKFRTVTSNLCHCILTLRNIIFASHIGPSFQPENFIRDHVAQSRVTKLYEVSSFCNVTNICSTECRTEQYNILHLLHNVYIICIVPYTYTSASSVLVSVSV